MRPPSITAADVGQVIDGVAIASAPSPGCYGCQGTGRLWWAGIQPLPCSCVMHVDGCEPECCEPACPSHLTAEGALWCEVCGEDIESSRYVLDAEGVIRHAACSA